MPTEPLSTPAPLERPRRPLRTALLCLPSWVPVLWAIVLVILQKTKPAYAHSYLYFKPFLYTASLSAILAPLCWIGALVGVLRVGTPTRFQRIIVAVSPIVIAATWFALYRYGRR